MTRLASVRFGASDEIHESPVSVGSIFNSSQPPPRFANLNVCNEIELPREVTPLLQKLLAER